MFSIKDEKGITMVGIMAIVAILFLLLAIALPVYLKKSEHGKQSSITREASQQPAQKYEFTGFGAMVLELPFQQGIKKAIVADFNGDTKPDILLISDYRTIILLENKIPAPRK